MTIDSAVLMFAGLVVTISLALGWWVTPWALLVTAFAGVNLIQAGITGFCPAAIVLRQLGLKPGPAFR